MNKKFSTLVAALLVSGVSYAVVSQIDGAVVANGVQTTATAKLNASLKAAIGEYTVAAKAVSGDMAIDKFVKWSVSGDAGSGFVLTTVQSGKNGSRLGINKAQGNKIVIISPNESTTDQLVELKVKVSGNHLQYFDNPTLFLIVDNEGTLSLAANADLVNTHYLSLFGSNAGSSQVGSDNYLANNPSNTYYLGADNQLPKSITATDFGVGTADEGLGFTIGSSFSAGNFATAFGSCDVSVDLVSSEFATFFMKIKTTNENYLYVNNDGGAITYTKTAPTTNNSSVTFGTNGELKIGDQQVQITATGLTLSGTSSDGAALATGSSAVVKAAAATTGAKLVKITEYAGGTTTSMTGYAITAATFNAGNVTAAALGAVSSVAPKNTWEITKASDAFTLTQGIKTLNCANNTANSSIQVVETKGGLTNANFKLDPADGAIYLEGADNAKIYAVRAAAGALTIETTLTEKTKLYLYNAGSSGLTKRVKSLDEITEKNVVVADAQFETSGLVNGVFVVNTVEKENAQDQTGTSAVLTSGANYSIGDGTNYLALVKTNNEYSLGTSSSKIASAALWTATEHKVNNSNVYYSFVNNQYPGAHLAFKVSFDKKTGAFGAPTLDTKNEAGSYDQFFIAQAGGQAEISFIARGTKSDGTVMTKTFFLDLSGSTWSFQETASADKFDVVKMTVENNAISRNAEWLNQTAGTGTNFGVLFKNMVDGSIKGLKVEENPFTDGTIKAVMGKDLSSYTVNSVAADDLSEKMFLRVAGSYSHEVNYSKTKDAIDAFRSSTFIVADTAIYSALINDVNLNFTPYTTVKGSELMSENGKVLEGNWTYTENDFKVITQNDAKVSGKYMGITRRIENAVFTVSQAAGAGIKDPVYFKNAKIVLADKDNKAGIQGQLNANAEAIDNVYIVIKEFGKTGAKKYYVGAAANEDTEHWNYVYIGLNNDVDYTDVNGIVNIISRNYATDGQVYANSSRVSVGLVQSKFVNLNAPEGQFLVTGGVDGEGFTFVTREYGTKLKKIVGSDFVTSFQLKTVPGKEDVYSVVGFNDTIQIVSSAKGDKTIGYKIYDQAKELDNKIYNLRLNVNVAGLPNSVYVKEAHSADHALAMDADSLEAAGFKLIKLANGASKDRQYGDSIFVSVDREYSVLGKDKVYETAKDTVVTFTYAIYNAANNEFVNVKTIGNKQFFYCNPDLKYSVTDNADALRAKLNKAQKFILKDKGNGNYNMVAMSPYMTLPQEQQIVFNTNFQWNYLDGNVNNNIYDDVVYGKLYAGLTEDKVDFRSDIYESTYNDLFSIVEVNAPKYRTVETAPFDTVRIYKEGMENVALFAETAKKEIVSGGHFLGMKHKADKDLTKTMFSFFVDTAYVNRADNYKPQYLLAIEADTLHGFAQCPVPAHGVEDTGRIDTVAGKFLTTMVDSIPSWGDKHNNPYVWETYPRLGFVNAKHIGDNLIVLRDNGIQTKADTIKLDNNNDKAGVFAFRYVDQASKSFLMETKGGWVKWLNGVPVVVSKIEEAEVFNFEATSNNPTSNDQIGTSEVSVIASTGSIIVKGAAGKMVAISNILGQTIVNTVLTSDNATIAVPAGIVVVAVEGEEAVKTVVK